MWSPYTDAGIVHANAQPARTRTVALEISKLAEISSDLLVSFYEPTQLDKPSTKQVELKKLTDIHTRLEGWKRDLPAELEPKDGQLPPVLLMHMFYQLLYIHLYRPFLRFTKTTSPLPAHVSPRKYCTQAANAISKLLRLYKRTHGLRHIINKVVYIAHSACTIHLLNLPDKNAKRDIVHGIKQLEEIGDCWTAARRTLWILSLCAERWKIELPDEAQAAMARARVRWGPNEQGTGSFSPEILASMMQQITPSSLPDMMVQNMQQQHSTTSQRPNTRAMRLPWERMGYMGHVAPSPPDSTGTRRSSGNFSSPPYTAADLASNPGRAQPSTSLTKEQEDSWSALQARTRTAATPQAVRMSTVGTDTGTQAAFGGMGSCIEESQDWWYNDQNQLAVGFENWTTPESDWNIMNSTGIGVGMSDSASLVAGDSHGFYSQHRDTVNRFPSDGDLQQPMQHYSSGDGLPPAFSAALQQQYQLQQHQLYNQALRKWEAERGDEDLYA